LKRKTLRTEMLRFAKVRASDARGRLYCRENRFDKKKMARGKAKGNLPRSKTGYEPWNEARAAEIIAAHRTGEGPALPMLHALQAAFGYIPEEAVRMAADALNITRAEMHGVVTFYHDFRREPAGAHVLKLCQAEACQATGARELAKHASSKLGIAMGETTPDRRVTLEPVYCLGLCATAPSAMFDDRVVGRLDEAKLDQLLSEAQQ
jgi:formate dehydrogenase subunit gamma